MVELIKRGLPPSPSVALNVQWMREHSHEYAGKWVAVLDGRLLDADVSLEALRNRTCIPTGCFVAKVV